MVLKKMETPPYKKEINEYRQKEKKKEKGKK